MPQSIAHSSQGREITWLDPAELAEAQTRAAYAYWLKLRGVRAFPSRDAMKMRDLAGLVSHMSLVRVLEDGADFEHRIVGDAIVRAYDVRLQNRRFSEIAEDAPVLIRESLILFRKVVETKKPIAWCQRVMLREVRINATVAEMILLPFGADDTRVDHIAAFVAHLCPRRA
ncbi:hypothetical protein FHS83_002181 [Rhizomicrobium palustre]|uniref:PAS domain-containing protein n=1 Tax=Rhizomicrobium palustre TaxID=189966 RepID=A0A846MZX8_9PROT|nr:PAS domain-containing protein [Rhizomicrobium palustre]NIK88863.1 hypothetical protein [Rhizomicrobium palustre]